MASAILKRVGARAHIARRDAWRQRRRASCVRRDRRSRWRALCSSRGRRASGPAAVWSRCLSSWASGSRRRPAAAPRTRAARRARRRRAARGPAPRPPGRRWTHCTWASAPRSPSPCSSRSAAAPAGLKRRHAPRECQPERRVLVHKSRVRTERGDVQRGGGGADVVARLAAVRAGGGAWERGEHERGAGGGGRGGCVARVAPAPAPRHRRRVRVRGALERERGALVHVQCARRGRRVVPGPHERHARLVCQCQSQSHTVCLPVYQTLTHSTHLLVLLTFSTFRLQEETVSESLSTEMSWTFPQSIPCTLQTQPYLSA